MALTIIVGMSFPFQRCNFFILLLFYFIHYLIKLRTEAYLEPSQTSTMELFYENIERLLAVNYFRKKAPS